LCGANGVTSLPPGARVGTSSLRRAAQLRGAREDLEVVSLRGNVDTRLRRLAAGDFDALLLALAGLERLGRAAEAGGALAVEEMVPAPGQGALAVEGRGDDRGAAGAAGGGAAPPAHARPRRRRACTRAPGATRRA